MAHQSQRRQTSPLHIGRHDITTAANQTHRHPSRRRTRLAHTARDLHKRPTAHPPPHTLPILLHRRTLPAPGNPHITHHHHHHRHTHRPRNRNRNPHSLLRQHRQMSHPPPRLPLPPTQHKPPRPLHPPTPRFRPSRHSHPRIPNRGPPNSNGLPRRAHPHLERPGGPGQGRGGEGDEAPGGV